MESFGRLGIDNKVTLRAFSQWNAGDREHWITSQNVYLGLTRASWRSVLSCRKARWTT